MTTFALYQCKECGANYESLARADRLDRCATINCGGLPVRVWSVVNIHRENIRAVKHG